MKISKAIFLMFFLTAITSFSVFADEKTPSPSATDSRGVATTNSTTARAPGDPDLPINQNLEILILGAMLIGVFFIYKDKIKKSFS